MIIFDTNAINHLTPDGNAADIIRKLRQSQRHRVAVPWMVMEELVAHKTKTYLAKHRQAETKLQALHKVMVWAPESELEPLDLGRFQDYWHDQYSDIFEVIETSGDSARMALAREALALPPAKQNSARAEGARDVAIWFSILEFMRANPDEHVYFVTANTKDFGDGTNYPYPMDEDLRGMEDRLSRLTDFSDVVSKFTKEVTGEAAQAAAERLLNSVSVRSGVAQTATKLLQSTSGFTGQDRSGSPVRWHAWLDLPETELLSVTEVTGHEIEGVVWYTARTQWLLYGDAVDGDASLRVLPVTCVWELKVLFSTNDGDEAPTLLGPGTPTLPDSGDASSMQILQDLKIRRQRRREERRRGQSPDVLAASTIAGLDMPGVVAVADILSEAAFSRVQLDVSGLLPSITDVLRDAVPRIDVSGLRLPISDIFRDTSVGLDVAGTVHATDVLPAAGDTVEITTGERSLEDEAGEGPPDTATEPPDIEFGDAS